MAYKTIKVVSMFPDMANQLVVPDTLMTKFMAEVDDKCAENYWGDQEWDDDANIFSEEFYENLWLMIANFWVDGPEQIKREPEAVTEDALSIVMAMGDLPIHHPKMVNKRKKHRRPEVQAANDGLDFDDEVNPSKRKPAIDVDILAEAFYTLEEISDVLPEDLTNEEKELFIENKRTVSLIRELISEIE